MNDDLISRQAAIEKIEMLFRDRDIIDVVIPHYNHGVGDGLAIIRNLPSAERKKGRWELAEDGWYCSSCKLYPPFDCDPEEKGIPFCPNCGAKMENSDE